MFGNNETGRELKTINVRPGKANGKLCWVVDLRAIGKGRKFFKNESDAKKFRDSVESEIWENGMLRSLTPDERFDTFQALDSLPKGVTLAEAARFAGKYLKMYSKENISLDEALAKFLKEKEHDGLSEDYIRTLKIRVQKFINKFPDGFESINEHSLIEWKNNLPGAKKTQKNQCCDVKTFLRWASRKGFVQAFKDWDFLRVRVPPKSSIDIFSPGELRRFLAVCPSSQIPALVIAAFAGIRTAEIQRLDWADIREEYIIVGAHASKVRERRIVEISPNLREWLDAYKDSGKVVKTKSGNYFNYISKRAGLPWKRNGLRHSWFSYKLALTRDVEAVALEGGNSSEMIFRNYREVVTKEVSHLWFSIVPISNMNYYLEIA